MMTSGNRMATMARYSENADQQYITKVRAITTRNSMSLHYKSLNWLQIAALLSPILNIKFFSRFYT